MERPRKAMLGLIASPDSKSSSSSAMLIGTTLDCLDLRDIGGLTSQQILELFVYLTVILHRLRAGIEVGKKFPFSRCLADRGIGPDLMKDWNLKALRELFQQIAHQFSESDPAINHCGDNRDGADWGPHCSAESFTELKTCSDSGQADIIHIYGYEDLSRVDHRAGLHETYRWTDIDKDRVVVVLIWLKNRF